ncbi:MAG: ATP phosphoribosyltransferase [Chloroflexi bacterium]|nr:ATP phosphoribosyltransferase [Chloroflexota bacterium]
MLRFALPSNVEMQDATMGFLASCGLTVERSSSRSLSAPVRGVPESIALFQRSVDIPAKVEEGTADLGVVGLDRSMEDAVEGGDTVLLVDDLGFGRCELAVAVPDAWVDVSSVFDLADLSASFREKGRELRVATKYPRLVRRFLYSRGLNYFALVEAAGAVEAAPLMGYADFIADIIESGATIRENRLKTIAEGTVLSSQAVLIGNGRTLMEDSAKREAVRSVLELVEGRLRAQSFYLVTANIRGASEEEVAAAVLKEPDVSGIQGPTIARVYSKSGGEERWFAVTVGVERGKLVSAVSHLRRMGGSSITTSPIAYAFTTEPEGYRRLLAARNGGGDGGGARLARGA